MLEDDLLVAGALERDGAGQEFVADDAQAVEIRSGVLGSFWREVGRGAEHGREDAEQRGTFHPRHHALHHLGGGHDGARVSGGDESASPLKDGREAPSTALPLRSDPSRPETARGLRLGCR